MLISLAVFNIQCATFLRSVVIVHVIIVLHSPNNSNELHQGFDYAFKNLFVVIIIINFGFLILFYILFTVWHSYYPLIHIPSDCWYSLCHLQTRSEYLNNLDVSCVLSYFISINIRLLVKNLGNYLQTILHKFI